MRAVLQRVQHASVAVDNEIISSIGRGVCVLVGIGQEDDETDVDYMVRKITNLRVFEAGSEGPDAGAMWKQSVVDIDGEVLCVSQFTLFGQTHKGNKPSFHQSRKADESRVLYESFMDKLRRSYKADKVKDGRFQAMMMVTIANDGPVTLQLDSRTKDK
ncbi:D-tyrosyl-tRNA(Tyr) deacylase [Sorochytrium milnesiophthora]